MNRSINVILAAALLGGAVTASAAEIAGNVTLATDYRFRGVSQLKGGISPALQGGFDLSTEMGFYVGTWASNINFTEDGLEIDAYGGYKGKFNEEWEYDVGVLYYGYPHDSNNNVDLGYTEIYGSVSFKGAKVGINYSGDYFGESGDFAYPYINYGIDLIENVSLSAHMGYNSFDENQAGLDGDDNYTDWSIGISTEYLGVTWALTYVDTNLNDDEDCFGDKDLCAATAVISMSKSL